MHDETEHPLSETSPDVNGGEANSTDSPNERDLAVCCGIMCAISCFVLGPEVVGPHVVEILVGTVMLGVLLTMIDPLCRRFLGMWRIAVYCPAFLAVMTVLTIRQYNKVDDSRDVWLGLLMYGLEFTFLGYLWGKKWASSLLT